MTEELEYQVEAVGAGPPVSWALVNRLRIMQILDLTRFKSHRSNALLPVGV
jgi:hypothetical protein